MKTTEEILIELIDEVRGLRTAVEASTTASNAAKASSDAAFGRIGELVSMVDSFRGEVAAVRSGVTQQIKLEVKNELDEHLAIAAGVTSRPG